MTCDRVVVVLALCIVGVAFWTGRRDDARIRELRTRADSLEQAVSDSGKVYAERRRADSLEALHSARVIQGLRANLNQATGRTDSILHDTVTTLDSSGVIGLRIALASEREAARELFRQQDSVIATLRRQLVYWRDTVVSAREQQLTVSQRLLREALGAKRPRTMCGLSATAGYGTGGPGVMVGYGCTVRLL